MVEVRTLTILTLMRRGRCGGEIDIFRSNGWRITWSPAAQKDAVMDGPIL
jgi:hypothetical protein